jgi:photosystem II stability/assembly factor-like uncharacterized protein
VAVGPEGTILRSADGGEHWEAVTGESADLYAVWGEGSQVVAVGWQAILRSTDGGATWTRVESPTATGLYAVWGEGSVVVAVGARVVPYPQTAVILRSTDGGATWTELNNPAFIPTGSALEAIWGSGSVMVTAGNWGTILRSTNRGASWEIVEGVENLGQVTAFGGLDRTLVAVTFSGILVSTDLGLTWSPQPTAPDQPLMAVSMPDERTVVAVGHGVIARGRR